MANDRVVAGADGKRVCPPRTGVGDIDLRWRYLVAELFYCSFIGTDGIRALDVL